MGFYFPPKKYPKTFRGCESLLAKTQSKIADLKVQQGFILAEMTKRWPPPDGWVYGLHPGWNMVGLWRWSEEKSAVEWAGTDVPNPAGDAKEAPKDAAPGKEQE